MFKASSRLGRIYQRSSGLVNYLNGDYTVVQIKGIPIDKAILCPTEERLKKTLKNLCKEGNRDVVIVGMFSGVDEEMVSLIRKIICKGRNVYVFIEEDFKQWYSDE